MVIIYLFFLFNLLFKSQMPLEIRISTHHYNAINNIAHKLNLDNQFILIIGLVKLNHLFF